MKRLFCELVACLLLLGCMRAAPENVPTPSQIAALPAITPTITPIVTPVTTSAPVTVLFLADCSALESADFFFGAAQSASSDGWLIRTHAGREGFEDAVRAQQYDGILVLLTREDTPLATLYTAAREGVCVAFADMMRRKPPAGTSYTWYDDQNAAQMALDVAIAYPPHDTPVRLIALLEEKGSPADAAFQQGVKQGRVFSKAKHYGTKTEALQDFVEDQLDRYVEGTVDAIYAENAELARIALEELALRSRTDMEVFCVPDGTIADQSKLYDQWTFPVLLGADLYDQAGRTVDILAAMLNGGTPKNMPFLPARRIPHESLE